MNNEEGKWSVKLNNTNGIIAMHVEEVLLDEVGYMIYLKSAQWKFYTGRHGTMPKLIICMACP